MSDPINSNYPFLSCIKIQNQEYIGIIINSDNNIINIYDISMILDTEKKKSFLELCETWWWESNRKIPINIFLKKEMIAFRPYIKSFSNKDIKILFGHVISLSEIAEKRVKRKSIQLVRSIK